MLPGSIKSSFVVNELDYLQKQFDIVYMFPFDDDEQSCNKMALMYNFEINNIHVNNKIKELFTKKFYKWLKKKEVQQEIKSKVNFSIKGLKKLVYIFFYGLYYLEVGEQIKKILEQHTSDSIILYSYWLSRGAYCISQLKKDEYFQFDKIISRAHGYDLYENRNTNNYLPFRELINNELDEINFISRNGLNYYNDTYPFANGGAKKKIAYLGTYNDKALLKKIKMKNQICIASCSSIINVKRLDLIIDILSQISIPINWIHIGDGCQREKIETYAKDKFKSNQYHFLGFVENSAILKTLIDYDVDFFMNLSDSEGVPVSIMEAISVGIPVIARDVGGIREIVNQTNGFLLKEPFNNRNALRTMNNMCYIRLYNIAEYQMKSRRSHELWENNFNARKNYNEFFREL